MSLLIIMSVQTGFRLTSHKHAVFFLSIVPEVLAYVLADFGSRKIIMNKVMRLNIKTCLSIIY